MYLQQILTALLDKGVDLSKDVCLVDLPRPAIRLLPPLGSGTQQLLADLGMQKICVFLPHHVRKSLKTRQIGGQTNCYLLPLLARRHALLQGDHAGLDVAIEDGLQVDLPTATRDDLIGDLSGTADAA